MKKNLKTGFTLVELIIVVSIIAVLASLAFMSLSGETAQARDSKRVSDLKTFEDSIATSNSKNKHVYYDASASSRITGIKTGSGTILPLRGSYLVPVTNGLFDSDVLPTAPRDPKGSPYFGSFLSPTDYQLFGTKENPDTKTPSAVVKGSFQEGSIIDILLEDITDTTSLSFKVANPTRFVDGDTIKIDNEEMIIATFNSYKKTITVTARGGTPKIHNKGAVIKLKTSATGADSLLCLGQVTDGTATFTDNTDEKWNIALGLNASGVPDSGVGLAGKEVKGVKCDTNKTILNDGTTYLPYPVTSE